MSKDDGRHAGNVGNVGWAERFVASNQVQRTGDDRKGLAGLNQKDSPLERRSAIFACVLSHGDQATQGLCQSRSIARTVFAR
jgi:hypothetical protein